MTSLTQNFRFRNTPRWAFSLGGSIVLAIIIAPLRLLADESYTFDSLFFSDAPASGMITVSQSTVISGDLTVGADIFDLSGLSWQSATHDGVTGFFVDGTPSAKNTSDSVVLSLFESSFFPTVGQFYTDYTQIGSPTDVGYGVWQLNPGNGVGDGGSTAAMFLLSIGALGVSARRFKIVSP